MPATSFKRVPHSSPSFLLIIAILAIVYLFFKGWSLFNDFRDGSKTVRFPENFLKVLRQKLQDIATGKNAAYVPLLAPHSVLR